MNDVSTQLIQIGTNISTEENPLYLSSTQNHSSILIFTSFESSGICYQGFCPGCHVSPSQGSPPPSPRTVLKSPVSGYTSRWREAKWESFSLHKIAIQKSRPCWNSRSMIRRPVHLPCFASFHGEIQPRPPFSKSSRRRPLGRGWCTRYS